MQIMRNAKYVVFFNASSLFHHVLNDTFVYDLSIEISSCHYTHYLTVLCICCDSFASSFGQSQMNIYKYSPNTIYYEDLMDSPFNSYSFFFFLSMSLFLAVPHSLSMQDRACVQIYFQCIGPQKVELEIIQGTDCPTFMSCESGAAKFCPLYPSLSLGLHTSASFTLPVTGNHQERSRSNPTGMSH